MSMQCNQGPAHNRQALGHMVSTHIPRSMDFGGLHAIYVQSGFYHYIIVILIDFINIFGDFWPILGNIGPFLKP
jgi:hypothetical protein